MTVAERFEFEEIVGFKFGYQPIGRPSLYSHIYFIDGLLIDTGHTRVSKAVFKMVKDLEVEQIFISHFHEDHSGNLLPLQKHFDCPSYASELCSELMKNPPKLSFAQYLLWGNRPAFHDLTPIQDSIQTKHYHFQIIPIPGHSPDMLALYEPERKWLFSADLFLNSYIGYFIFSEDIRAQMDSLKRVLQLDFEVLLCGHNPKFRDGKKHLQVKLAFLEEFYAKVAEQYQAGYEAQAIFKRLALKENKFVKFLSGGQLSKINMVRAVIRDLT